MGNNRYDYQAIIERKKLRWPNKARIALWVCPNIESTSTLISPCLALMIHTCPMSGPTRYEITATASPSSA